LSVFIFILSLSIITPFFPSYASDNGISEEIVGFIFSANPLGAFIAALILGKIINEVTHFQTNLLFYRKIGSF